MGQWPILTQHLSRCPRHYSGQQKAPKRGHYPPVLWWGAGAGLYGKPFSTRNAESRLFRLPVRW